MSNSNSPTHSDMDVTESSGQASVPPAVRTTPSAPTTSTGIPQLKNVLQELIDRITVGCIAGMDPLELTTLMAQAETQSRSIRQLEELSAVASSTPTTIPATIPSVPAPSILAPRNRFIPADLPTWQWTGNVWNDSAVVHDTVEDLLSVFEMMVQSNGLDLDADWSRLAPIRMSADQRSWYNESLRNQGYPWDVARAMIIETYAAEHQDNVAQLVEELVVMRMSVEESVESFTDRFHRVRRAAKWENNLVAAIVYKRALPDALMNEIDRALLITPLSAADNISKITTIARKIMASNIGLGLSPLSARSGPRPSSRPSSSISFLRGTSASRHNPANARDSSPSSSSSSAASSSSGRSGRSGRSNGVTKTKKTCILHKSGNHSTEECNMVTRLIGQHAPSHPAPVHQAPASTSGAFFGPRSARSSSMCRNCNGNVPHSREHFDVCPRDSPKGRSLPPRHNNMAFRSARLSSGPVTESPAAAAATTSTATTISASAAANAAATTSAALAALLPFAFSSLPAASSVSPADYSSDTEDSMDVDSEGHTVNNRLSFPSL